MKRSDKGKKVFGVFVILAIFVSVFGGVVSAEDLSGGLKQNVDDAEIETAVGNLSSADQNASIGSVTNTRLVVPFFSQKDPQWKDDLMGSSGQTIGQIGCAMTCTAMLLKYYGVSTDPGVLNAWLSTHGGYTSSGAIYWAKPAEYSNGKMQFDSMGGSIVDNDNWGVLNDELSNGYPVIVQVDAYPSTPALDSHWVLVTGREGSQYYINDPWDLSYSSKLLSHYYDSTYDNTFFGWRVYHGSPVSTPPSPPTLTSPGTSSEPGEEINTLTPTFRWNSVSNADSYGLYISKYPYGSGNLVFEQEGLTGTSFNLPSGYLQDGVKYRWNMKAFNGAGESGYSSRLYFWVNILQPPSAPTLISPGTSSEPGEEINTLTPTFRWNSVSNADSYGLYISKYPYGSGNIIFEQEGITGTSLNLPGGYLQDGVKYRWNMKAFNGAGESGYSSQLYFWIDIGITDQQKQQEILNIVNSHRGSLSAELILAVIRQEGGEGAFHVDGWNYNDFYRESEGAWAQPTNGDGVMQVTAASGYHENSGPYTHDWAGYDHAINDGCDYLLELYSTYATQVQSTIHYNTGPNSLYIYLGKSWGDRDYLSHVAEHLSTFVPNTYGLSNQNLVNALNQGQGILDKYLYDMGIATGQSVGYYEPYQTQLDSELHDIETPNQPPTAIIDSITPDPAVQGSDTVSVSFSGHGTDTDGTVVAYNWRSSIGGQLSTSVAFTKPASELSVGTHTIYFKVQDNDGAWSTEDTEDLTINPANEPPTAIIDSITPDPAEQGTDTVSFSGHGTDTDGTVVAYNWRSSIGGQLSTSAAFTKPASELSVGTHTIYFKVQDNDGAWSTEDTEDLTINPANEPPTAIIDSITPDPAVQGTDTVTFTGHGTDPDGTVVAYNWRSSIGGQLSTSAAFTKPASELSVGTHTIYFKVQDNDGAWSTEDTEALTINPPSELGSISVTSSPSGANIYLDGSFIGGQTPYTITNVPAGVHTIGLSHAGYQDWSTNVQVTAGETSYVYATLSPIPNPSLAAAVFRAGLWILPPNYRFNFGMSTDIPVVGDWNGDGVDTIGVRRGRQWILSNSNAAPVVAYRVNYGLSTDIPVVGDWNGDGVDTIGVRRGRQWILSNSNTAPVVAYRVNYGLSTDIPVVGDWNGDGVDTVGVRRGRQWILSNSNTAPSVAYRVNYGLSTDIPVVGDWNGDGVDTVGVRRGRQWILSNSNTAPVVAYRFNYGMSSDEPVTGDWI